MLNYTRTVMKISRNRCHGVMNPNFKVLVHNIVNMHEGAGEGGTSVSVYGNL